jgi:hypothetical protein
VSHSLSTSIPEGLELVQALRPSGATVSHKEVPATEMITGQVRTW